MTDRFKLSPEDEYPLRPSHGRGPISYGASGGDPRFYGASPQADFGPTREFAPPDYDGFGYDDFEPAAPLAHPATSHRAESFAAQHSPYTPRIEPRIVPRSQYDQPAPMRAAPQHAPPELNAQYGYGDQPDARRAYPAGVVYRPQDRMAKAMHWVGAVCSVAFLIGAVFWAYELAVRDVRGIPVVRAAEGPLRIAPEAPGGKISANQGLAVNAIAANGAAEDLPDEVVLAPAPLTLAQEDISLAAPAALTDLAASLPDEMPISDEAAVEAALAMALAEGDDGPMASADELAPEPVTMSNADTSQPVETAAQDASFSASATLGDVDPAMIPVGTKMVQLGAYDDAATARTEWINLQTKFADLMGAKAMVVQQAKSGGREFFRLRAHGFENEDETRRFCAALLAENASCIPVAQR